MDGNGNVTAVGAGTAVITARAANGKTDTVTVTVMAPASGVTIRCIASDYHVGAKVQLTAVVSPADASGVNVVWTSSNEKVATVNAEGLLSLVGTGTTTITVTTPYGLFATMTITVK